ncbi:MAG: 2,3-diketo-5-methylthiopentyl-1-phosphate enolase [Myxococcales bacterium]|nr:2,3-diketo-5-methylthiopentyl-1-phosphate enolase [Myxococcales bacterium]
MSILVDYRIAAGVDAEKHAKVIAVGQTAGTWSARFEHRRDHFEQHLGVVEQIQPQSDGSNLATVRFPTANVEDDIGSLLTMVFGKYSMAGTARVEDIRLPDEYGQKPTFGITGIREQLGVYDRPLVMAIFKPALGLSAYDHGEIFRDVAQAGIDVIKDDEILGDLEGAPTLDRLKACREQLETVSAQTGKNVLYAVNVTGRADLLFERAHRLVEAGANALLLNVLSYGYSVLEGLAADPQINVPIFAHPALAGALSAAPDHGISYPVVLGTMMAHAGADAVLYPAHYGSLPFPKETEMEIRDRLRNRNVLPVPSAGIHPGVVPLALADYGTDVVLNAGTGIMDHPDGPGAGTHAFFEALAQAKPGVSFELEQIEAGPLRRALEKWGTP